MHVGDAVTGHVKVGLEGDWLDTRVEFRAGELAVELVRIRSALARKDRWVVLDDGTLARISSSIERLVEEVGEVFGDADGGTLPVHQFGRLERWLEENDGRTDVALRALRKRLRALEVTEPVVPVGLRATLRPYQRHGLAWLQFLDALGAGGILADDMGLGKTVTTLAFVLASKERAERTERARKRTRGKVSSVPKRERHGPTLVVCPTSVIATWVGESKRFTPDLRVHVLHGPKRDVEAIRDADLVVTTYAILRRDADALAAIRFRLAVLDEAQNVKNAQSATTRAANRLDATMRVALTGTPMENRLHELWSIASFANPGILGTARSFEHRFERPIVADRTSAVVHELRAVVRPFLLRRTKAEVLSDLPPKTEIDRVVSLSVRDKRLYDALALTIRSSLAEDIRQRGFAASSLSVFTALTRLRQMACDPRLVDGTVGNGSFDMSAKREAFLELVRELVAERRRALVFSQFVSLLTLWRKDLDAEGIAYEYLDGSTRDRAAVVDRFQEGTSPLFLISLKAGGAGLNLTAADTVIHCDPWWNPAVEDQATDRAYRIGQDKPVTVVRLVARGTIEEKIESLKGKKRELTKIVVEGEGRALDGLTEEDVRMLLGDADAVDDDGDADDDDRGAAELLADESRVLHPEFDRLVRTVSRFHRESGRTEAELSAILHVPTVIVGRLLLGRPFPCSRALASSIVDRIRKF
ncbi:MAG: SNF2-related protein [Polyangiaceae bacterium]